MDRDEVLNNYYMQEDALVKYGFKRLDNLFIVEKTLKNNEFASTLMCLKITVKNFYLFI